MATDVVEPRRHKPAIVPRTVYGRAPPGEPRFLLRLSPGADSYDVYIGSSAAACEHVYVSLVPAYHSGGDNRVCPMLPLTARSYEIGERADRVGAQVRRDPEHLQQGRLCDSSLPEKASQVRFESALEFM